ncbi:hypothetical protein AVV36_gp122 [Pectobacterium bacteriophage PM2]|uniref:DUF7202 domain-containing protein n=1 Tax=Pectobacterium bacteriophage PM2 TaxID=1429794 RepID=A0A0A0PZH4_9CAUD|nr:hypothetical protein AVV36_gp122 [Pectobacterium bacteriophage PM2]AHY25084.1 hypothetical protein PM2_122 [Pectobacterium bacteriophage PM2]
MNIHYPHPYDPKNKSTILRVWKERRQTKCPNKSSNVTERWYTGTYVEYTYINKKKQTVYIEEYCILVEWD